MANERRVFQDFLAGTITNVGGIAAGATSFSSAELASMEAVTSSDFMVITLDPDDASKRERVTVTAHTAGATSCAISATANAHAQSAPWRASLYTSDVLRSVDRPWAGDLGYDQEFDRYGAPTSLPTGWSWFNQGTATYREEWGAGIIQVPAINALRGIKRALPVEAAWAATLCLDHSAKASGNPRAFIGVTDGTKLVILTRETANVKVERWANATTISVETVTTSAIQPARYLRLRRNSSTSWDFEFSADGRAWCSVLAANDLSGFLTPTDILIGAGWANHVYEAAFHWFRVR